MFGEAIAPPGDAFEAPAGWPFSVTGEDQERRHDFWRKLAFRRQARVRELDRWLYRNGGEDILSSVAGCGRAIEVQSVAIAVRSDGRCYAQGVVQCGRSVCPLCTTRKQVQRSREVEAAATAHVAAGGRLAMLTLTLRHTAAMPLVDSLTAIRRGLAAAQHRKAYGTLRGLTVGSVKALEVTVTTENGWHPHFHVLLFVRPGVAQADVESVARLVGEDWRECVGVRAGLLPSIERGSHVAWLGTSSAGYIAKVAKEVAFSNGKSGSRSLFALLDDGEERAHMGMLFVEAAKALFGVNFMTWSPGLRDLYGVPALVEEWRHEGESEADEVVATLPAAEYNRMWREGTLPEFFERVEAEWRGRVRRE